MRYEMGVMDLYPIVANRTKIENNPFLKVTLKEAVDEKKLLEAVKAAIKDYPLFGCTLGYHKGYFLETNDKEIKLIPSSEETRPLEFGKNTNGYLWQICYDNRSVSFEWCHGISDGRGGYSFFISVLHRYFGVQETIQTELGLGLESFYDKEEKGLAQKKQEKGFKAGDLPYLRSGYQTDCHILKVPVNELLAAAKKHDATPAAILPPLFSRALRKHLKPEAKNKNVSCNVVIDCRGPMGFPTMRNCILSKVITYVDRFDTMDFSLVSTVYRGILDLAVCRENIVCEATSMVNTIKPLVSIRPRILQRFAAKIVAMALKHEDSNFTFTYLGKMNLPEELSREIADFHFRSWTDFGECNMAAIDFNGTLILNICENYQDKEIIPDFINICKEFGIHFEETEAFLFEQANLRM